MSKTTIEVDRISIKWENGTYRIEDTDSGNPLCEVNALNFGEGEAQFAVRGRMELSKGFGNPPIRITVRHDYQQPIAEITLPSEGSQ